MAIDVSEWTLLSVIQQSLTTVQAQAATQVPEIFPQLNATLQQQIITSLSTGSLRTIPVELAYLPANQPALPAIYLYAAPGGEEVGDDVIGSQMAEPAITDSSGTVTGYGIPQNIMVRKVWQITCGSTNITDVLVMVALVKNALLGARQALGQTPNAYIHQAIQWTGWSPMANSAGDVIFPLQQTVIFTITTIDSSWSVNSDLITGYTPYSLTASD